MTGLAEFCITTLKSQFRGISNLITIDRRASKPLYQQIYDSFRSRIIRGELRAGDLVPSSRELARESRISRLPVLTAYAQLLAEGYFESRVGAGTFISSSLPSRSTGSLPSAARGQRLLSAQVAALPKYERPSWAESLGPFQVGQPELQKFPIEIWLRLVARYSRRMRLKALQYAGAIDRKSTRLNSSHSQISYAVFCLKKKTHSLADILASVRLCCSRHRSSRSFRQDSHHLYHHQGSCIYGEHYQSRRAYRQSR